MVKNNYKQIRLELLKKDGRSFGKCSCNRVMIPDCGAESTFANTEVCFIVNIELIVGTNNYLETDDVRDLEISRDTSVSKRFTPFTYICIIYWLCIVIVHKDRL